MRSKYGNLLFEVIVLSVCVCVCVWKRYRKLIRYHGTVCVVLLVMKLKIDVA
jgi:hypothetical protein